MSGPLPSEEEEEEDNFDFWDGIVMFDESGGALLAASRSEFSPSLRQDKSMNGGFYLSCSYQLFLHVTSLYHRRLFTAKYCYVSLRFESKWTFVRSGSSLSFFVVVASVKG